ncbi:MAG: acetate--CoA ligase family protein [Candidatus Heimdallarchaeaceae archaeon]
MSEEIKTILREIKEQGRTVLTYEESRKVMELASIPLNKMEFAINLEECIEKAKEVGYPIVLKIISKDVIHKTEAGGVKVGIKSEEELMTAYEEMMKSVKEHYPEAKIEGVSIEEMVEGVEVLVGQTTDPQFGKMIAFGIGGIYVEVYKDVSFRLIPITEADVREMYAEIKGRKMLEGFRGKPAINLDELTELLLNISKLVEENPIIKEMDLNPVMVTEEGLKAIDARIILENE